MNELNTQRCINVVMLSDGRGWIHTDGLRHFGLPELEIVDLPRFLYAAAASLLQDIGDLMLSGERSFREGDIVVLDPHLPTLRLVASPAENDHPLYSLMEVWRLVDCEDACRCELCTKPLAS